MTSNLLACPFCGGEASFGQSLTGAQTWLDHVECLECGALSQCVNSQEEAALIWNKRTITDDRNISVL